MARPEDPTARARILEAAGALFYERGVNAVTMTEIVTAAGTGKHALYRHFPSKEALVLCYLQEIAVRMDESMDAGTAESDPPAALVHIARHVAQLVRSPGYLGCPMRNYLRETRDIDGPAGRFALERVWGLRHRIEQLVTRLDVDDSAEVAHRIWLVLEGIYATTPYTERLDVADSGVRYVEEAVGANSRPTPPIGFGPSVPLT